MGWSLFKKSYQLSIRLKKQNWNSASEMHCAPEEAAGINNKMQSCTRCVWNMFTKWWFSQWSMKYVCVRVHVHMPVLMYSCEVTTISAVVYISYLGTCGVWVKRRGEMLCKIPTSVVFSINRREDQRKSCRGMQEWVWSSYMYPIELTSTLRISYRS
jgi:hypothetical protein